MSKQSKIVFVIDPNQVPCKRCTGKEWCCCIDMMISYKRKVINGICLCCHERALVREMFINNQINRSARQEMETTAKELLKAWNALNVDKDQLKDQKKLK